MPEINNSEVFNEEIAELEAKLAAKKHELQNSGVERTEKATFNQVVREHVSVGEGATVSPSIVSSKPSTSTHRAPTPEEEKKISLMIAHAFTHGIATAVSEAKKFGDPYFVDLLHDRLADEYYAKLLAAHKVNPT